MKNTRTSESRKHGWSGKILQVDLLNSKVWEEDLSEELARAAIRAAQALMPGYSMNQ